MNLPSLLVSPEFALLFKWSWLLALGWIAHWILRHRHARWRVILWRGILCIGVALPILYFFPVPGLKIPINTGDTDVAGFNGSVFAGSIASPIRPVTLSATSPAPALPVVAPPSSSANSLPSSASPGPISWGDILMAVWALGCFAGAFRLIRLQQQLSFQKKFCRPAPDLQQLARQIQDHLDVRREIEVQISEKVTSPFVCGLLKPMIILPQPLVENLSPGELSALLSHEIAHLRQHDLIWCVAWQWMKAACWFHPLVWRIPSVHSLACEQEADRIASGQLADRESYSQLLARLALRVLALPAVETKLTLNGSSQIARRLSHLARQGLVAWNWKHTVAGFGLVGVLFMMTAGCGFSKANSEDSTNPAKVTFKEVSVMVQDEDGKPIEGATIQPRGFRVKGRHSPDAYSWNNKLFGPPEPVVTGADGKAMVKYPVMGIPAEKELTGAIFFDVTHPEYATADIETYYVDQPEQPIQLTRGMHLEVSAYFGSDHQPVTDLVPNLNEVTIKPEDWKKKENGVYEFDKVSPGGHLLQLMGRLPSGEIVYSEAVAFTVENLSHHNPADTNGFFVAYQAGKEIQVALEMKPGIRLEGRLDDSVPRPVKNGRVLIDVRPEEFPAWHNYEEVDAILKEYPDFRFWRSYRTIAADGTFVFESIPPGEVDVIVHGDGFVSKNGGDFESRSNSVLVTSKRIAVPQSFPLVAPVSKIEVATEPTATLVVTAKTKSGKPIEGATVYVSPNVLRMGGFLGWMKHSSEEPFRTLAPLPNVPYFATTDKEGIAIIQNVPAITGDMDVDDAEFQVPLQEPKGWRDRHVRLTFSPGITNNYALTMEPKGRDFLGTVK